MKRAVYNGVSFLTGRESRGVLRFCFLLFAVVGLAECLLGAQIQPAAEEGIPVTDSLVKEKCAACHPSDEGGNMKRLSWERATPEAWGLAIQRMTLIDDVDLTPEEKDHILQYLSTSHGFAPEEATAVAYDVERRIHEETGIPGPVTKTCARCHNFARILSWRRSLADWKEFSQLHALRYNFEANEEAISFIANRAPLHTAEWSAWSGRPAGKSMSGRWLVTASSLGRVRYYGEMEVTSNGMDGNFDTQFTLQSVRDGKTVRRTGHGTMYGSCAWRGFSKSVNAVNSAPDDLSNEAREVLTGAPNELSANGRWFWGQYQELGFDIKVQRASPESTLLGVESPLLKTGSQSNRVRLFGDGFPASVSPANFDFGPGLTVHRIVTSSPQEIVVEVDVGRKAPVGKRTIGFGRSTLSNAIAVFDRLDYIKVTPESAMAAFGGSNRDRGYQQFEAIGYLNGPDGKRHSDDDIELGPVDVMWSMKIFYESEGQTDSVGAVSPTGLFVPAADSTKNNFDVWVIAQAKAHKDPDGQPLEGKAYLVVTVPFYIFNGRRYVRDLEIGRAHV